MAKQLRFFESVTGERKVIDILMPGYNEDMVTVTSAIKGEEDFVITVKGKYQRPRGKTDKLVKRFGYDKVLHNSGEDTFKNVFDFPCEKSDYDVDSLVWTVKDGVMRISIPKTAKAIGKEVKPLDKDKNINAADCDEVCDDNDSDE